MLTKEEVQHIASLARIELSAEEVEKFQKELGTILDFVGKLNEVDTLGVEPTAQVTGLTNALREDGETTYDRRLTTDDLRSTPRPDSGQATNDVLLNQAPQKEGNYVKVKAVFE